MRLQNIPRKDGFYSLFLGRSLSIYYKLLGIMIDPHVRECARYRYPSEGRLHEQDMTNIVSEAVLQHLSMYTTLGKGLYSLWIDIGALT